mgnify:CR=1 FL=1
MSASEYPQHPVYDKNTIEFVTVAAEYCSFIERCAGMDERAFLDKISKLLPLLYLKMALLPEMDTYSLSELETYVSERQYDSVREQIRAIIGAHDEYLEVFHEDMQYSDTPILATISENLTDVYQQLRDMIGNFQSADVAIMNDSLISCNDEFKAYWGQSALNALRAVHNVLYSDAELSEGEDLGGEQNEVDFFND